jgi:hypothetical protein
MGDATQYRVLNGGEWVMQYRRDGVLNGSERVMQHGRTGDAIP